MFGIDIWEGKSNFLVQCMAGKNGKYFCFNAVYQFTLAHLDGVPLYVCQYYPVHSYSSLLNLHYFHRDFMEIQRTDLYLICHCFAIQIIHKYLISTTEFSVHKVLFVSFRKQLPHGMVDNCRKISTLTTSSLQNANRQCIILTPLTKTFLKFVRLCILHIVDAHGRQ